MFSSFILAWKELSANKSRSVLTALGIIIGVFSVSLIISLGDIANQYITSILLNQVGDTRLVRVDPFSSFRTSDTILTEDDLEFLQRNETILPYTNVSADYARSFELEDYKSEDINQTFTGTTANYPEVFFNNFQNLDGRFFTDFEYNSKANVAVVSRAFIRKALGRSSALGETFTVENKNFTIIGEYDAQAGLFSGEEQAYIPLSTLWSFTPNAERQLQGINMLAPTESQVLYTANVVKESLNAYREQQFLGSKAKPINVRIAQQALDTIKGVLSALQVFLSMIAVISLIVGGIGVTNVMLMSVTQRIREIGIRKALGANTRDIITIFLSESVLLTTISGIVGAGIAQYILFLGLESAAAFSPGFGIEFVYSWSSLYVATVVSAIIGVLFGLYPAWQASKLSIVEALRFD